MFVLPALVIAQERQVTGTVVKGKITKEEIEQKVPGATVTEKGKDKSTRETVYEVRGDHNLINQKLSGDSKVSLVRGHVDYSSQQLQAMNMLGTTLLDLAGTTGWRIKGGSWVHGSKTQDHDPKVLCWVCSDCPD